MKPLRGIREIVASPGCASRPGVFDAALRGKPGAFFMRLIAAMTLCTAAIFSATGCESGGKHFIFGPAAAAPQPPGGIPSTDALVEYLNLNSSRIQSLRCTEVDVEASQGLQSFNLRAKLMTSKPRNFLMRATAAGMPVVDVGSNSEEFWFWSSKIPDPH